jgi:hypothetical protein
MSKPELLQHSKDLAEQNRKISLELIECLKEVEKRMLFADLGYSSLWEFAVQYLKLSEGSAQRKIASMRLISQLPEAHRALVNGSLSITNAAQLQSHFRREAKKGKKSSAQEKLAVVQKMAGLSKRECEKELLKISPESIPQEKERSLTENLTELRFVVDQSVMKKLERLKGLLAYKNPGISLAELFELLVTQELEKLEKKKAGSLKTQLKTQAKTEMLSCSPEPIAAPSVSPPPAKVIAQAPVKGECKTISKMIKRQAFPASVRRKIWNRAGGQCEFIGENGKRCTARRRLEFDHHPVPVALGGKNNEGNGRLACKTHNLSSAVHVLGRQCMQKWLPGLNNQPTEVGGLTSGTESPTKHRL